MIGYRPLRRIVFWTFVALFFVTASLVLFYAFGYRYSFERGIFVYSGSITLQTTPEDVVIRIDGDIVPKQRIGLLNNSIHIAGLTPGEYYLEVSAPGYKTWTKRALVSSGISTEFWNIVLPREAAAFESIPDTSGVIDLAPEPTGSRLAFPIEKEGETSLVIFDRETGARRQVFASTELSFRGESVRSISWSPSRNRLLLPLSLNSGAPHPMVVDIRTGETILLSDTLANKEVTEARWDGTDSDAVLLLAETTLYRLTLEGSRVPTVLATQVQAYDVSGGYIYLAKGPALSVYRMRASSRLETETPVVTNWPDTPVSPLSLVVYDDDRLALLERAGSRRLFVYNKGTKKDPHFQKLGDQVSDIAFSNDGKKLLFFGRNEMSVYFALAWEVQPAREEGSVVQVARFSDGVQHVGWTEDYEHLLFSQNETVKLVELDHRDRRVLSDLVILPRPPLAITPLFRENRIFFVVPGTGVSSIVFPEPQGLFGQ